MPIRGSPNGARHPRPQAGRDRPEWVVAINRNAWSQSIGIGGRDHPVRACLGLAASCEECPAIGFDQGNPIADVTCVAKLAVH
jgi:hypothetical protein